LITSSARNGTAYGNGYAERLRGVEVDDQLEFGWLLHR